MKKFISALTALFIGAALLSATAGAEPSEPVSYFDIEQNITGEYDGIPENGIPKEDGFYLPSGYTVFDITGMYFSEDMTVIHITDDKMTVAFAQYVKEYFTPFKNLEGQYFVLFDILNGG